MTANTDQVFAASACMGKQKYPAYDDAQRVLDRIRRAKGRERDRSSLRAYRCKFCRGWHIGSYERDDP
jgi:hypothetical protein